MIWITPSQHIMRCNACKILGKRNKIGPERWTEHVYLPSYSPKISWKDKESTWHKEKPKIVQENKKELYQGTRTFEKIPNGQNQTGLEIQTAKPEETITRNKCGKWYGSQGVFRRRSSPDQTHRKGMSLEHYSGPIWGAVFGTSRLAQPFRFQGSTRQTATATPAPRLKQWVWGGGRKAPCSPK